jgi:hypothetical protein
MTNYFLLTTLLLPPYHEVPTTKKPHPATVNPPPDPSPATETGIVCCLSSYPCNPAGGYGCISILSTGIIEAPRITTFTIHGQGVEIHHQASDLPFPRKLISGSNADTGTTGPLYAPTPTSKSADRDASKTTTGTSTP